MFRKLAITPLSLFLILSGCGDGDQPDTCEDCEDVTDDAQEDVAQADDTGTEPDVPAQGTGTIEGTIFYNGDPINGALTIALFEEEGNPSGDPTAILYEPEPVFHYAYAIDAPLGTYYVHAWLNTDGNDVDVVDEGDLYGRTENYITLDADGATVSNINVEVR